MAEVALLECEGSVEEAVTLLLEQPEKLVLWSQQPGPGKTRKSKSAATVPTTTNANATTNKPFGGPGRRVDSQRGLN